MANVQYTTVVPVEQVIVTKAIDTEGETGVKCDKGIAPRSASFHLSNCERRVIDKMRQLSKRKKAWQILVSGNDAGVRTQELLPPDWEHS